MEQFLGLFILATLFLAHIIMSGILIKKQQNQIEWLYKDLEKQYLKRYELIQMLNKLKERG